MNQHMILQIMPQRKRLCTHLTRMVFFPRMREHVPRQFAALDKCFLAHDTAVVFLAIVVHHVTFELASFRENPLANLALKNVFRRDSVGVVLVMMGKVRLLLVEHLHKIDPIVKLIESEINYMLNF